MKRKLFAFLAALLLLSGCSSGPDAEKTTPPEQTQGRTEPQQTQPREEKMVAVRALTGITSETDGKALEYTVAYSDQGICYTRIFPSGDSFSSFVSFYDLEGRLIREEEYDETGTLFRYGIYSYDENGNCISEYLYSPEGSVTQHFLYFFHEGNRITRYESWNSDNRLVNATEYAYHDNGGLKTETHYGLNSVTLVEEYTQDAQGRTVHCDSTHYKYPEQSGTYDYIYDEQGHLTASLWEDTDPITDRADDYYTYNAAGRVTMHHQETESRVYKHSEYTYDEEGYLISFVETVSGSSTTLIYQELTLPEDVARAAEAWSKDGVIDVFCSAPNDKLFP